MAGAYTVKGKRTADPLPFTLQALDREVDDEDECVEDRAGEVESHP